MLSLFLRTRMSLIVERARAEAVAVMIAIITAQIPAIMRPRVRLSFLRSFIFALCSGVSGRAGSLRFLWGFFEFLPFAAAFFFFAAALFEPAGLC